MRTFLLFAMAALLATQGFGQFTRQQYPASNEPPDAEDRKTGAWNVVSVHLTQMLVREVQFSYERSVLGPLSLEGSLGARIPNLKDYQINGAFFDTDINYKAYPFMRSYYGALGVKANLIPPFEHRAPALYVAAVPFYRYNLFPRTTYTEIGPLSSTNSSARDESKYQRIYGLKMLVGFRLRVGQSTPSEATLLDLFAGVSVRRIMSHTTTYGRNDNSADPDLITPLPEPETVLRNTPFHFVQLGAKLSFAWAH